MKITLASLFALLALALLYFATRGSGVSNRASQAEARSEIEAAPREPSELDTPIAEAHVADVRVAPQLEKRTALQATPAAAEKTGAATLEKGSVLFVDDTGIEHAELNGEITFLRRVDDSTVRATSQVEQGFFEFEAAEGLEFTVEKLVLDDCELVLDSPDEVYVIAEGPIVVRAIEQLQLRLSVLDAATGAHLSGVTVVSSSGWETADAQHPGLGSAFETIVTNGISPVPVPPHTESYRNRDATYLAHSPGFAWKTIHLDLSQGGAREIQLEPGGDLTIQIVGELKQEEAQLRLYPEAAATKKPYVSTTAKGNEPIELIGLPPGNYRAAVEVGKWYSSPVVLGHVSVQVVEGETSHYELLVQPPPLEEGARLSGRLVVPTEWNLGSFELKATLANAPGKNISLNQSEMTADSPREESWSFDFGKITLGEYTLEFLGKSQGSEVGYDMTVVLEQGGLEGVRFEVPPPTIVILHLLDSKTGEPAEISSIYWGPLRPGASFTLMMISEDLEEANGEFEFRAPLGRIFISDFGNGYEGLNEIVQLGPHRNEFTFRLGRECPLLIQFLVGETPVPPPDGWWPTPKHLDGDGELLYVISGANSGFDTALSQPGRYLFEVPDIEGFEPIPDQTITLKRGEETKHVIQLVRKL